nr:MAG TPA: hypothetical protein [Caudoviricetes sp.]
MLLPSRYSLQPILSERVEYRRKRVNCNALS